MKNLPPVPLDLNYILNGDVVLFHTKFELLKPITWLSALIRLFTNDYYNHAGIIWLGDDNLFYIVESLAKGVEKSPLVQSLFMQDCKILRLKNGNPYSVGYEMKLRVRIKSAIGIKYDYSSLFLFQLIKQFGEAISPEIDLWLGQKNSKASKRFYCSEFVAWCLRLPKWYELAPDDLDKSPHLQAYYEGNVYFNSI